MKLALAQVGSTPDPQQNLATVQHQLASAAEQGARLVVFPEAMMSSFGPHLPEIAEPLDGRWATAVGDAARELNLVCVVGMFTPDGDRVRNTLLVTGAGVQQAHYDKTHLYDALGQRESEQVAPGDTLRLIEVDGLKIGLATCYDVRFPAQFTALARAGAELIVLPACWASGPGKREQWQLLIKARALDSTCWLAACDQPLPPDAKPGAPRGIGYSAVLNPLGVPQAELDDQPSLLRYDLNVSGLAELRAQLPVAADQTCDWPLG